MIANSGDLHRALLLILLAAGCARAPSRRLPEASPKQPSHPSHPSPEAGATGQDEKFDVIQLERQTFVFQPSRDDFTVGKVVFSVHCSRPEEVRVNGREPASWNYIYLARVGKNLFELAPLRIEIEKEPRGLLCMSLKVWFEEVTNQSDGLFYEKLDDRYALVAFCTRAEGPDWERAEPRFSQNRVESLEQFKAALSKPFELRLNQRPLDAGQ